MELCIDVCSDPDMSRVVKALESWIATFSTRDQEKSTILILDVRCNNI
jgi:hypothetical protein